MDFNYTQDQRDLAGLCRNIFTKEFPASAAQELYSGPGPSHSPSLWKALAEAGLLGLSFDEAIGGSGASLLELGIAFREAGRCVAPSTLATTFHAALLIDRLGTPAQRLNLLPPIINGNLLATVALSELGTDQAVDQVEAKAEPTPDGWMITGIKTFVANAEISALWIVAARVGAADGAARTEFFILPSDTEGVSVSRQPVFGGDTVNELTFDAAVVPRDAILGDTTATSAAECYRWSRTAMNALRSMEMVGGAEFVLERTAEYVSTRHQFGRPIGSFQAVQHIVANMGIDVTAALPAAQRAVWSVVKGGRTDADVAIAASWAARTYVDATIWAHQVHGGMGFARESSLYLWSERAKALELECGGTREQYAAIAAELFGPK